MKKGIQNCLMLDSEEHYDWLLNYSVVLREIHNKFSQIKHEKREIVFAVDFYDMLQYSFPFLNNPLMNSDDVLTSNQVMTYLARSFVIDYYKKPKLILPPYVDELNTHLGIIKTFFNSIDASIAELKNLLHDLFKSKDEKEIRDAIAEKFQKINNYLMLSYDGKDGLEILRSLFDEKSKNRFRYLDNFDIDPEKVFKVLDKDNKEIEERFCKLRDGNKYIQNLTDAKAIQLVQEINSAQDKYLFFLISGAQSMQDFFRTYPEYNFFLSLEFFRTLVDLTFDLSQEDSDYYDQILTRAQEKLDEIEKLYGINLHEYNEIMISCSVIRKHRDRKKKKCQYSSSTPWLICDENCDNIRRCENLVLKENIDTMKSYIERIQNTKYIIKGINPFTKKGTNIEKKILDKVTHLKQLNSILADPKSHDYYSGMVDTLERLFRNENYIFLAKNLPYMQDVNIAFIEEFNDFPYYLRFSDNETLNSILNNMKYHIERYDAPALTDLFRNIVSYSSSIDNEEDKWLVWMMVFFTYGKQDQVIDFYENYYIHNRPKENGLDFYLDEFKYIYGNSLYQEVVGQLPQFEENKKNIFKNLKAINTLSSDSEDPRLLWIRLITAGLFYEHNEFKNYEDQLILLFGKEYSLSDNQLINRVEELIAIVAANPEFETLKLRFTMNKAYLLAMSDKEENVSMARDIMEKTMGFPDKPLKSEGNYLDTYAYILMKFSGFLPDISEQIGLLEKSSSWFEKALAKTLSIKYRGLIEEDLAIIHNKIERLKATLI